MAKPTILIVEDEEAQRLILQHNLEEAGYEVISAADGEIGSELIKDYEPDVIVLDWMMPRRSGVELCRQIKSSSSTKNIPVILYERKEHPQRYGYSRDSVLDILEPFGYKMLKKLGRGEKNAVIGVL